MIVKHSKEERPREEARLASFERTLLPHLDSAYNLARWITGNDQDAEDLVEEVYLRAWKSFNSFAGDDGAPLVALHCAQHVLYLVRVGRTIL